MAPSTLHVETFGGDGAPLLALHGISGFGARYARLAEHLPDRRWICPDLRGHGASPATAPWATADHVADLLEVLDRHDADQVALIGHSFGGHLALHLLGAAPERVGRVVLLDPASLLDGDAVAAGALAYARDPGWDTRDAAVTEIGTWFTDESRPDFDLEVERNLVQDDEGRWRMRFSPAVIGTGYGEMARPLPSLPADRDVLLLEADPAQTTVNDRLRAALQTAFGDRLRREVVPGAGHVIFRTSLRETADAITRFLA